MPVNRYLRPFKAIAAQVARRHGLAFGVYLREHGLQDFLLDEVLPTDGGQLAALEGWVEAHYQ
jgi:hypothetical protein